MAVTRDITQSWRAPRVVMRRILDQGRREDRAIAYLMIACLLIFVAQWPRLSRLAAGFDLPPGADVPELDRLVAYEFLAWLMIWPLFFYLIGGLTHLVARLFGGQGSMYAARMALFWALLATTPAMLLYGMTAGFFGPGIERTLTGSLWLLAFILIWVQSLREAEKKQ